MGKNLNTPFCKCDNGENKMKTQTPKNYIKKINVFYTLGEGVIISADIESKSRRNLLHYTRIVLDPLSLNIAKYSCDCEGFTFKRKCWHIETLRELVNTELKEQIEKVRDEMLEMEKDIASWGQL